MRWNNQFFHRQRWRGDTAVGGEAYAEIMEHVREPCAPAKRSTRADWRMVMMLAALRAACGRHARARRAHGSTADCRRRYGAEDEAAALHRLGKTRAMARVRTRRSPAAFVEAARSICRRRWRVAPPAYA